MIQQDRQLKHGEVSFAIVRAFYDVYNELGHGFLESVYREALALVLRSQGHRVDQERPVEVYFRGKSVGLYRADIVVDEKVIVELKCKSVGQRSRSAVAELPQSHRIRGRPAA